MSVKKAFRKKLKQYLYERDMTQKELADECGICASKISNYLAGRGLPNVETLVLISESLRVPTDCLLGLEFSSVATCDMRARDYMSRLKRHGVIQIFEEDVPIGTTLALHKSDTFK